MRNIGAKDYIIKCCLFDESRPWNVVYTGSSVNSFHLQEAVKHHRGTITGEVHRIFTDRHRLILYCVSEAPRICYKQKQSSKRPTFQARESESSPSGLSTSSPLNLVDKMKMEDTQVSRRRVSMIAAHFAANDDVSALATHLLPVNCSSSLTSFTPRRDSKVSFARQGSSSQACFMRQVSEEPQEQQHHNTCKSGNQGIPFVSTNSSIERYQKSKEAPLFSRPIVQDYKFSASESPRFARPYSGLENTFYCEDMKDASKSSDNTEWSPRMDIGEQGYNYLLLVELPGVCTKDIRVEVNNESLIVKGKRSIDLQKVARSSDSSISGYHKMGIFQGPYHVAWPLPTNVDKDNVSAEFVNGLLRINIPKL